MLGTFHFTEAARRSPFVRVLDQSNLLFSFTDLAHGRVHPWSFFWTCNLCLPVAALREAGVECRNYFVPIHLQPFYRQRFGFREGDFPVTEAVAARTIALPFYNRLSEREIDYVGDALETAIRARA